MHTFGHPFAQFEKGLIHEVLNRLLKIINELE